MNVGKISVAQYGQFLDPKGDHQRFIERMLGAQQCAEGKKSMASGNKPIVVCGGAVTEAKDMDDAQRIAESEAHSKSADAYILKPVRRVAPKRDVVTTELA